MAPCTADSLEQLCTAMFHLYGDSVARRGRQGSHERRDSAPSIISDVWRPVSVLGAIVPVQRRGETKLIYESGGDSIVQTRETRLPAESPDSTGHVCQPAADAIAVGIVRVRVFAQRSLGYTVDISQAE
jgi:hypothetical protein